MRTRLFLVFCSLFAAASAVSAQSPPTSATLPLDHFNCYFTKGPTLPQPVQLLDQFDITVDPLSNGNIPLENVRDLTPFRFCNPVQKTTSNGTVTTVTRITHPDAHLLMYWITNQPSKARSVLIRNQFTSADGDRLITGPAVILAVPSGKALISSTAPPTLPTLATIEAELDHFKCYQVSAARNVNAVVTLVDQFSPRSANGPVGVPALVLRPYLFCNPVVKVTSTVSTATNPLTPTGPTTGVTITPIITPTITPVDQPLAHLTCYWIASRPPLQPISVFYNNQFAPIGTLPILVSDLETLCVPSLKLSWSLLPPS